MSERLHDVFLSYSRNDSEVMRQVRGAFISEGITVWTDEGIEAGTESWRSSIQLAIEYTGVLIVLLSPDAKSSIWVNREIDYAQNHGKKIFPLLVRGNVRNAVPFSITGTQLVNIIDDFELLQEKLIPTILKHLNIHSMVKLREEYKEILTAQAEERKILDDQWKKIQRVRTQLEIERKKIDEEKQSIEQAKKELELLTEKVTSQMEIPTNTKIDELDTIDKNYDKEFVSNFLCSLQRAEPISETEINYFFDMIFLMASSSNYKYYNYKVASDSIYLELEIPDWLEESLLELSSTQDSNPADL